MTNLIEISLDENTKIYIESATDYVFGGKQFKDVKNSGDVIAKANDYFEGALNQIKAFANSVAGSVKDLPSAPNEVELEFAVKFAACGRKRTTGRTGSWCAVAKRPASVPCGGCSSRSDSSEQHRCDADAIAARRRRA